jgi:DNA mismatch endonuclease, patch repair protein
MRGNQKFDTRPETAVRSVLHRRGLRFRKHVRPITGLNCSADVVFRREQVVVFVDGCYWHGCPEHGNTPKTNATYWKAKIARNVERDRRNDLALRSATWLVIRIWEHEDVDAAAARIESAVKSRRKRGPSRAA